MIKREPYCNEYFINKKPQTISNKRTNNQLQLSSTANHVQCNSTMINQQLKSISVSSSAEWSNLTDMSIHNQQHIYNMESEIAKV